MALGIKVVPQELYYTGCGIAAIATVLQSDYLCIKNLMEQKFTYGNGWVSRKHIVNFFERHKKYKIVAKCRINNTGRIRKLDARCLVLFTGCHWIVYYRGFYFDPLPAKKGSVTKSKSRTFKSYVELCNQDGTPYKINVEQTKFVKNK